MKNADFYNGNIAFIKTDNVRHGYIDRNFNDYLSELGNEQISRTTLQPNDIITTIIGATEKVVARSAIIQKDLLPCNINQNIVQIRVNDAIISPYYVYFYLNSFYGKNYLYYYSRQTEQINLNCNEVSYVRIPRFSNKFQSLLDDIFVKSQLSVQNAEKGYKSAEELLNIELHINGIQNSKNYSIKSYLNSFCKTKRLDAEYYQDKYDKLFPLIKNPEKLSNIVKIAKSIEPGSDEYRQDGIPFIRVSDLSKFGISETEIYLDKAKYKSAINHKKDSILFSKDGSIGIAYKVEEDIDAVTSSALLHLTVKTTDILPDYLALTLNSNVVQLQAERDSGGSIIEHWRLGDIKELVIPVLDIKIQTKIAQKVQESFRLRNRANDLLKKGIQSVEIAIEKNEEYASQWLIENTNVDLSQR
ncbi:putative uncharacterized protein [Succinatimonas sp. CAG:777]|nr:putative uncharacterized protein [Succinatimonas sp. CAG:777]